MDTIANTRFCTFDLDLGIKVTLNVAQYPQHHVTYAPAKFEVVMSNGLEKIQFLTLTLASRSQNIAHHPLHHVTYAPAKLEVAKFNDLGDAFTRKYSICPLTLT